MQIDSVNLKHKSNLMKDYQTNNKNLLQFFDYNIGTDYTNRIEDLQKRQFPRKALTDALLTMNEAWDAPEETKRNIKRLSDPQSVAVVGGQQAGLLTGPMYTIN